MIFTSFEFILFFVVSCGIYALLGQEAKRWFLLAASYVFYMSWSVPCALILFTSSVFAHAGGVMVKRGGRHGARAKRGVLLGIVMNLLILAVFKYAGFLSLNLYGLFGMEQDVPEWILRITLPVGISFFTFQAVSYVVDVVRGDVEPSRRPRDTFLYVAFFPQLVAGPIVRAADFLPQLRQRLRLRWDRFEVVAALVLSGAAKKMVISDQIAPAIDGIFAAPERFEFVSLIVAVLGFAAQIYCDFSGYTDIAIGCALFLGFRLRQNFRLPYISTSIIEFWRRWHISLSSWLRDYLYIPLGGNRRGEVRTYRNLMIVMLLGGLWHGASWNFVVWGGIHGVGLAVCRWMTTRDVLGLAAWPAAVRRVGGWAVTFALVMASWIFFRCRDFGQAWTMLARIASFESEGIRSVAPQVVVLLLAVAGVHVLATVLFRGGRWERRVVAMPVWFRVAIYGGLTSAIVLFGVTKPQPFIYFQF